LFSSSHALDRGAPILMTARCSRRANRELGFGAESRNRRPSAVLGKRAQVWHILERSRDFAAALPKILTFFS